MRKRTAGVVMAGALLLGWVAMAQGLGAPSGGEATHAGGLPQQQTPPAADARLLLDEAALAPHFAAGPLAKAQRAFQEGAYAQARELLLAHDDGSPQAAYLLALASLEVGRVQEAARLLRDLAPRLPTLSTSIHWHLGLALERLGDLPGAAAAFGRVEQGSVRWGEAVLARGHALRKQGKGREALDALAPLASRPAPAWGNDRGASALFLSAVLHGEAGRKDEARAAYLKVWSEHPLAPEAEDARLRAEALAKGPVADAILVKRAQHLIDAHRNEDGVTLIRSMSSRLKLPDPLACEAHLYLGRALRKLRRHSEVRGVLPAVVDACTDRDVVARAFYLLATSTSIVAPQEGAAVWRRLASTLPDHSYADDALFFAAEIERRAGRLQVARDELRGLIETYPEGDYRKEALFQLFWLDRQAGRPKRGLAALRTLEAEAAGTADGERALYWLGRTLEQLGRKVEAVAAWKALVTQDPASYYAMLARGRLAHLDPAWVGEIERSMAHDPVGAVVLDASSVAGDPHLRTGLELLRLGFSSLAADEFLLVDRRVQGTGESEPALVVAHLLDRADSRRAAHQIARTDLASQLRGPAVGKTALRYRVAFPLAYRDLIEANGKRYGVPPDLMQALMREESSLDPNVVSWAGAVGLTQLMPSTARAVAQRLGLGAITEARLRDPALNVRIGTAYLGSLLERWKGSYALACASYNAGPGAVSRWLQERGHLELDEFVEEIPIDQTRGYVKRVLGSYSAYKLIYGEKDRHPMIVPAKASPR